MSESEHTAEFCKRLTEVGALVIPIVGGMYGKRGAPDRLIISKQWQGLIEFKYGDKGRVAGLQHKIALDVSKRKYCFSVIVWQYDDAPWLLYWFEPLLNCWYVQEFNGLTCGGAHFLGWLRAIANGAPRPVECSATWRSPPSAPGACPRLEEYSLPFSGVPVTLLGRPVDALVTLAR